MRDGVRGHRGWAEIDLGALRHNVAVTRDLVGPRTAIMAVVKANAYGHGVEAIVRGISGLVEMFGVANVTEAEQLQQWVPPRDVFILGTALPDERPAIVRHRFVPAISTAREGAAYAELVEGEPLPVHLAVDTGMGRIGIPEDCALEEARAVAALSNLRITGIATHLPVADEDEEFTREQLARFGRITAQLHAVGITAPLLHALNSAGILARHEPVTSMVRAGLMLYGSAAIATEQRHLRPVLTWKAAVTLVRSVATGQGISYGRTFIAERPMLVATLGLGYADGYQRHLSGRGADVLIRGRRCALLGRVTMDQIMVDVTEVAGVVEGDEAVLVGRQGDEEIFAADLAAKAGTIAWDLFTGIGSRVERVYL